MKEKKNSRQSAKQKKQDSDLVLSGRMKYKDLVEAQKKADLEDKKKQTKENLYSQEKVLFKSINASQKKEKLQNKALLNIVTQAYLKLPSSDMMMKDDLFFEEGPGY